MTNHSPEQAAVVCQVALIRALIPASFGSRVIVSCVSVAMGPMTQVSSKAVLS